LERRKLRGYVGSDSGSEPQLGSAAWGGKILDPAVGRQKPGVGIVTVVVAGGRPGSVLLGLLLAVGSIVLPIARRWWIPPEYGAELEIAAAVFLVAVTIGGVIHWRLIALHRWTALPFSESRSSALCLIAAIVIFNLRGGTYW
jgi:hypothetical protein